MSGTSLQVRLARGSPPPVVFLPLPHKIRPPGVAPGIRSRLLDLVGDDGIVVLSAPSGYGKTALAAQLAAAAAGPTAWYTADEADREPAQVAGYVLHALARAWPDLAGHVRSRIEDDYALARLAYVLGELAGPGCLVLDDFHLLGERLGSDLLEALLPGLPPGVRLVVCTGAQPPLALLEETANGRAIRVSAESLRLTREEVADLLAGETGLAAEVEAATGGWPLAVGLAAAQRRLGERILPDHDKARLGRAAVAPLGPDATALLALVGRLPRFPAKVLRGAAPDAGDEVDAFVARHPSLLVEGGDWWTLRDFVGSALADVVVPTDVTRSLARHLAETGETDLAVDLALREALWPEAAGLLARVVPSLLDEGRFQRIRDVVADLPSEHRSAELVRAEAEAAVMLGVAGERDLVRLGDLGDGGDASGLRAAELLARFLYRQGDPRAGQVAEDGLRGACGGASPDSLRARVGAAERGDADRLASLLTIAGFAALMGFTPEEQERARALLDLACAARDRAGSDSVPLRGGIAYVEGMMGRRPVGECIDVLESVVGPLRLRRDRRTAATLFALGQLRLHTGEWDLVARASEEMTGWAEPFGEDVGGRGAAVLALFADVARNGPGDDTDERAERIWVEGRGGAEPRRMGEIFGLSTEVVAEFDAGSFAMQLGHLLLDLGDPVRAALWVARADGYRHVNPWIGFWVEMLGHRLRLQRGDHVAKGDLLGMAEALDGLGFEEPATIVRAATAADLARAGRVEEARTLAAEVSGLPGALQSRLDAALGLPAEMSPVQEPGLVVRTLGSEITVERDGEATSAPTGYAAKLLAFLVAAGGPVAMDAVMEALWPECDPDVGRNRLHGVVLRLRRALGVSASGPVVCDGTLFRLAAGPEFVVDAWEFTRALAEASGEEEGLALYGGDFCSEQFAYEDFAIDYRRDLRRRFATTARTLLQSDLGRERSPAATETARRVWEAAPEDPELAVLATDVLSACGHGAEAGELRAETRRRLADLGLDPDLVPDTP